MDANRYFVAESTVHAREGRYTVLVLVWDPMSELSIGGANTRHPRSWRVGVRDDITEIPALRGADRGTT